MEIKEKQKSISVTKNAWYSFDILNFMWSFKPTKRSEVKVFIQALQIFNTDQGKRFALEMLPYTEE